MAGPSILVRVLGDVTGLGKSFDEAGGKGKGAAASMHSAFRGTLDALNQAGVLGPFGAALATADSAIQGVLGHGKELGPVMMGVGGAVAGVGLALTAMGSKDQAAHQQLQAAVEATGHSYDEYASRVQSTIKTQEHFGTTADKTQDSLRILTQATNDPTKALDEMQLAANLAAAKHEDLTTASGQLAKAINGSGRILKEFGITTKDASGATKSQSEIVAELSAKLSGQASASANTFTGRMRAMKATVEDTVNSFGQKWGPAVTGVGMALTGLGAALQIMTAMKEADTLATVAHTVASTASAVATGVMTAAQWALNVAMDANPVMLIVIAMAALVAGVILAYQHITVFRQIVDDFGRVAAAAFGAVVNAAQAVWAWIQNNWPLLLAILLGPFATAVYFIVQYWGTIVSFFAGLPGRILGALGNVGALLIGAGQALLNGLVAGANAGLAAALGFVASIGGRILGALGDVGDILYGAGKAIIDGLGRGISDALHAVESTVSGIAGKIASLKGPLDDDARLLVPHGTAIMAGFNEALAAGISDTERIISGVAPTIAAGTPSGANAAPVRSGPAVNVENVNVSSAMDVDSFMARVAWTARTVAA